MNRLAPCESREQFPGGGDRFRCTHPLVVSESSVVSRTVCRTCTVRNITPDRPAGRARKLLDPCLFAGPRVETQPQTFSCTHPCHQIVTTDECRRCLEYASRCRSEQAVETWAVGMTTAPRAVPTLKHTLRSLDAAGWSEVFLFAEPGSVQYGLNPGHQWCPRGVKLGAFPNWYLSLTELVMRVPEADAYLMLQDDVVFSQKARTYLEQRLWPVAGAHVVSLYCAAASEQPGREGFVALDAGWSLCGALALVFRTPWPAPCCVIRCFCITGRTGPATVWQASTRCWGCGAAGQGFRFSATSRLWHSIPANTPPCGDG